MNVLIENSKNIGKCIKKVLKYIFQIIAVSFCLFVMILIYKKCDLSLCHEVSCYTPPTPPSDEYCAAWNYDYKKTLEYVMDTFNYEGPSNYFDDHVIDCKDWAVTFLYRWYTENTVPDGTCVLVRQVNKRTRFNHLLVGIWTGKIWLIIEPQAYNKNNWTPEAFWGKRYDPNMNQFNQTRDFIIYAFDDYSFAKNLVARTNVEATYGKSKIKDGEIIPDFMFEKFD